MLGVAGFVCFRPLSAWLFLFVFAFSVGIFADQYVVQNFCENVKPCSDYTLSFFHKVFHMCLGM